MRGAQDCVSSACCTQLLLDIGNTGGKKCHECLQGFGYLAWVVVALQVFGGLIVGMVVKYADNILKNFANALSVIFTVIGAMPLFGQYPSIFFVFGIVGVLLSVFMYGKSTPSGFGAFDSCYRSMSTANLQLLLQSTSSGTRLS